MIENDPLNLIHEHAGEAAAMLRLVGNENRLVILCSLVSGEQGVGALHDRLNLSQSALSQHLAKMREDGLISARRESQNVYYQISDERAFRLISALAEIFCPDELLLDKGRN